MVVTVNATNKCDFMADGQIHLLTVDTVLTKYVDNSKIRTAISIIIINQLLD